MNVGNRTTSVTVDSVAELGPYVGRELGVSGWTTLQESDVLDFGALTRDHHWIHSEPERARAEAGLPGVLAHGFLVLALLTGLGNECYSIRRARRWTNYGMDTLRFTAPVLPGDEIRLRMTLKGMSAGPGATTRLDLGCEVERRDGDRPALVATWIVLVEEAS